jgi:hypothetical protein
LRRVTGVRRRRLSIGTANEPRQANGERKLSRKIIAAIVDEVDAGARL